MSAVDKPVTKRLHPNKKPQYTRKMTCRLQKKQETQIEQQEKKGKAKDPTHYTRITDSFHPAPPRQCNFFI